LNRHPRETKRPLAGAAALLALLAAGAAHASGVHAILTPASGSVEPDSTIDVQLQVNPADAAFNSFGAVVSYDSTALTFQQLSPLSAQQGCLMTGTCGPSPRACGTTFHRFIAAADSLKIDLSALCDGFSTVGPGQLYTLRFKAAHTEQVTTVHIRHIEFYNGGIAVTPVSTQDSQINIHRTTAVGPATRVELSVSALPNPARGALALVIRSPGSGEQVVDVLDASGRLVRTLQRAWSPAGSRTLTWDGTSTNGERLPAGVYLARVRAGGLVARSRIVLLH
jgi:hypothetical protein